MSLSKAAKRPVTRPLFCAWGGLGGRKKVKGGMKRKRAPRMTLENSLNASSQKRAKRDSAGGTEGDEVPPRKRAKRSESD